MLKRILALGSAIATLVGAVSMPVSAFAAVSPPPADPTNVSVSVTSSTGIVVSWTDNSTTETQFSVYISKDGFINDSNNAARNSDDPANIGQVYNYELENLEVNTRYWFKVVADDVPNSVSSNAVEAGPVYTFANVPGQITVGTVTTNSIPLTINANGNPEYTEYGIIWTQYADINDVAGSGSSLPANGVLGNDGLQWLTKTQWEATNLVQGLQPNTLYSFRIFSRNTDSLYSPNLYTDTSKISTLPLPAPDPAPAPVVRGSRNRVVVEYNATPEQTAPTAVTTTTPPTTDSVVVTTASTTPVVVVEPTVTVTTEPTGEVLGEQISRVDELVAKLKYNDRGSEVAELQTLLRDAGFFPKWVKSTGWFGPITRAAVAKYKASK